MKLQTLLAELSTSQFLEQYFLRFPLSLPATAKPFCEFGTWEVLAEILVQPGADVLVARDGQPYAGRPPSTLQAAKQLSDDGYTVLVRHAERHSAPLNEIAQSFAADFSAPVDVHIYATPPGRHGFGWHYDAEDVFIIQTSGSKEYAIRKNTVHPWPLVETLSADMGYPREIMPLMRVSLNAGDWLYIPCGYWHKAEASGGKETSISLAIGVLTPAAVEVLDFARRELVHSLVWRQRLPVCGTASNMTSEERFAHFRELFQSLGEDLKRSLTDERFVRAFIDFHSSGRDGVKS